MTSAVDTSVTDSLSDAPIIELRDATKDYGDVHVLKGIDLEIFPGQVTCILGDNGAGKSTLIKILAGRHKHTSGEFLVDGEPVHFSGPKDALDRGIATVYQDLAVVDQMSVWRNFFLGQELTGKFGVLKADEMRAITAEQLEAMGVHLDDVEVPISTLSGGQRQVVAIARAVYFGARVLILDEPTAALGVKQSGMVLKFVRAAAERGVGVVLITHNPHHAYLVGNHFILLNKGEQTLDARYEDVTLEQLTQEMAGGGELESLNHELSREN
ncbi:ATP-binding cassette domain-containing protein [Corynebacterium falsenii]|uniref:ATP-binding cassette domain-containing protein n=1 Tax=Corynebacterium falsenii TaxID=108486 RepID=UPI00234D5558|nr:ATP-binding cassette domain-containing protein [Corynebacterium falsenii]MDC7103043.1 ATP-binding cassette domain-containing protein [Corynebacterium falsenii]